MSDNNKQKKKIVKREGTCVFSGDTFPAFMYEGDENKKALAPTTVKAIGWLSTHPEDNWLKVVTVWAPGGKGMSLIITDNTPNLENITEFDIKHGDVYTCNDLLQGVDEVVDKYSKETQTLEDTASVFGQLDKKLYEGNIDKITQEDLERNEYLNKYLAYLKETFPHRYENEDEDIEDNNK